MYKEDLKNTIKQCDLIDTVDYYTRVAEYTFVFVHTEYSYSVR